MVSVEGFNNMEDKESSTEELFKTSKYESSSEESASIGSSLIESEDRPKVKLYKLGQYDPGSGEICTKYITMSRSSMIRHVYYKYPSLKDPGIIKALCYPEDEKLYEEDGQELYLDLCKQMNIIPVRCFYRDLKKPVVNLRYYGLNPVGIRAMCLALAYNKNVTRLDLTSNFLNHDDACYHLGQLLGDRNVLEELVLEGCNIGHRGMKRLVVYLHKRKMKLLDLTCNNIRDEGFMYLAYEIQEGAIIRNLKLKRNDLTSDSLTVLAEVIEFNDTIKHLDLSWNKFMKQKGPATLVRILGNSQVLTKLNLAWTGLSITTELRSLFCIETLQELDLSNNRLPSLASRTIARSLVLAKNLEVLDLSCNPFTPSDALFVLIRMKNQKVNLKELYLDHIVVSKEFLQELKDILTLTFRQNALITHGDVLRNYVLPEQDIRVITMRRIVLTFKKKRKNTLDILLYLLEQQKKHKFLDTSDFTRTLKMNNIPVKDEYIHDLVKLFPGPKTDNGNRTINLNRVVDYIHRLWPDKKLPPTPPPTPPAPPPELPPITKKKAKGRKGK